MIRDFSRCSRLLFTTLDFLRYSWPLRTTPTFSRHSRPLLVLLFLLTKSRVEIQAHTQKNGFELFFLFLLATLDLSRHSRPGSLLFCFLLATPDFSRHSLKHAKKNGLELPFLFLLATLRTTPNPSYSYSRPRISGDTLGQLACTKKDSHFSSFSHSRPRSSRDACGQPAHAKKTDSNHDYFPFLTLTSDPAFLEALLASQHTQKKDPNSYFEPRPRIYRDTLGQPARAKKGLSQHTKKTDSNHHSESRLRISRDTLGQPAYAKKRIRIPLVILTRDPGLLEAPTAS